MSDVIVRIVAGILMAGCIAAYTYTRRMWLSMAQNSILWGVVLSVGVSSLMVLVKPAIAADPPMIGILVIFHLLFTTAVFWVQQRTILTKIRNYKQLAEQSSENDDPATAKRYQALADLTISQMLSLGLIKELRDMGLMPPNASTGQ